MIFPFFYETKADHTMSLWNVFAMLAARFFLRLCSILCFLDFPALWLGRFGYHPSQNKDHQIPDHHMGVLRHDSSIPTRFFAVTLKVVFKRNERETNSNLNLPISRTTRHGTTVLALPSRGFWMNLTLHMDIEANPGPEEDAVRQEEKVHWVVSSCTGTQKKETLTNCVITPCMVMKTIGIPSCTGTPGQPRSLEPYLNYCATTTIAYSRNQLLNLRSKYSISQDLLRLLKNQDIFKSRGGRAGVSFRNKIFNML